MSFDEPDVDAMRRHQHPPSWRWLLGDSLRYLGALLVVGGLGTLAIKLLVVLRVSRWPGGWQLALGTAVVGVLLFAAGTCLRGVRHRST